MVSMVSMDSVKRHATEAGSHWFERGSMRFFRSRLPRLATTGKDGRAYFVSSEDDGLGQRGRRFSVRAYDYSEGNVTTVGPFMGYATRKQAETAMRAAVRGDL